MPEPRFFGALVDADFPLARDFGRLVDFAPVFERDAGFAFAFTFAFDPLFALDPDFDPDRELEPPDLDVAITILLAEKSALTGPGPSERTS
ncbi:MAG: hypothetical protein ABJC07_03285 [Acidobacteriota bacterium]